MTYGCPLPLFSDLCDCVIIDVIKKMTIVWGPIEKDTMCYSAFLHF